MQIFSKSGRPLAASGTEFPFSGREPVVGSTSIRHRPKKDDAETCKGVSVHVVAAIRLLLLTGCRKGEILNLRWSEVDLAENELRVPDTKTGPRTISLSPEAAGVLAAIPRVDGNPFVIPGRIRGKAMRNLNDPWDIVYERAGLEDLRIHDARHSYASRALALGESLPMIGRLLGHTQVETTARVCASGGGRAARLGGTDFRQHRCGP